MQTNSNYLVSRCVLLDLHLCLEYPAQLCIATLSLRPMLAHAIPLCMGILGIIISSNKTQQALQWILDTAKRYGDSSPSDARIHMEVFAVRQELVPNWASF